MARVFLLLLLCLLLSQTTFGLVRPLREGQDLSVSGERVSEHSRTVLLRNLRDVPIGHEVHLQDTNPLALIHYSGSDSKVILIVTYPSNTASTCNVYISTNYGDSFNKINTRLEQTGPLHLFTNIIISPEDYRTIIIPHLSQGAMYISTDEGQTFNKRSFSPSTISPRTLKFHPTKESWFLAHDPQTNTLYVSQNLGTSFTEISKNVNSTHEYLWGNMPYDTDPSTIYYNVDSPTDLTSEVHLYIQKAPYTAATRTEFDPQFGVHDDFLMIDRYIFAQKTVNQRATLYVSYDRKPFKMAHLPSELPHQNYYVASLDAKQALVIVQHTNGQFNLYLSEEMGIYYSLSLPDIVFSNGVLDLEIVDSMNGTTYICNQNIPNSAVRTLISFDAGGNWEMLRPPTADTTGTRLECILPSCSLHLHMSSSQYWRTGVYSTASAPGIIIAHGVTGAKLNDSNVNLFISRDGGVSWNMTLKSSWGVNVLDYGGLIVAAQDYHQFQQQPSKQLAYSCNEGRSWSYFQFSQTNTVVFGVITEPGQGTAVVSLYGWQSTTSGWVVIRVNFTNSFTRSCTPNDYYMWTPYDAKSDTGCLLGASVQIERRNPSTCCLSGKEYSHNVIYSVCSCIEEDFECDYGYEHANGITGSCIRDESISLPDPCDTSGVSVYYQSQGYRKIGGDVCTGGIESQYAAVEKSCCEGGSNTTTNTTTTITVTTFIIITATITATPTASGTAGAVTDKEGDNIAVLMGVLLLVALFIILAMFIVLIILVVKYIIRARPGSGNYSRVPADEGRVQYRNGAESPTDDDDDERPLPL